MEEALITPRVLVVDDSRVVLHALTQILAAEGYQVTVAESSEKALELFHAEPFPVVFSDIVMPGISGLELLRQIKQSRPDTQVIMITGHGSLDNAIMALRLGASEYLKKPFEDPGQITSLARQAFEKIQQIQNTDSLIGHLRTQIDDLEQAKREFKELSIRDGLTGLYNHRYFQASLSVELSRARRHERGFSLVFIDLDHFKHYNDTHGHPAGDKLLVGLGKIIQGRLRNSDLLARYGGEEFTIILPETSQASAVCLANEIRETIARHPFPGRETQPLGCITASFGVSSYPDNGQETKGLVSAADQALYRAKGAGRNVVCTAGTDPS